MQVAMKELKTCLKNQDTFLIILQLFNDAVYKLDLSNRTSDLLFD